MAGLNLNTRGRVCAPACFAILGQLARFGTKMLCRDKTLPTPDQHIDLGMVSVR